MKLLVVDDNKDITDVVRFYCDSKALECAVVNTGNDGLEVIRNNNGLDVIKSLKNENLLEKKNIVVFTASSDPKVIEEIRNSGVKEILKKPYSVDALNREIS